MALSIAEELKGRAESLLAQLGLEVRVHTPAGKRIPPFDLLTTVEQGGCSAKLPPDVLFEALGRLTVPTDPNLLVGIGTGDDAGVYRLTDEIALIETTDFFPPVCSDPYDFGQIAAANALSDVYAMGGKVLTAMNLVMFPACGIPFEALHEIVRGGQDKVLEAGGLLVGGHTIADYPPKYGLAVTGVVHPDRLINNANAEPGQALILTKPLGTGALVAGQRLGQAAAADYQRALDSMKQLNRAAAEIMQEFSVRAATDITGFGLLGHALNIAKASGVTVEIDTTLIPSLPGALELLDAGCIPGASFRNLSHVEESCDFAPELTYTRKMLTLDPQTSGGILLCAPADRAEAILAELLKRCCPASAIIGRTSSLGRKYLVVR
ncbi:MAG: selenide, water dikinase SelD [Deltaproteobacteria bacterium]|nr:selenide, water dikinase SelD [Deltaproteobacteria bacterium]TLN03719.1 MAG: selenide, water dikinase SelD [bacterium]